MLVYSTRFRVNERFTPDEFVKNVAEWNKSGRYSVGEIDTSQRSFIAGDDKNFLELTELAEKSIIAAHAHTETDSGVWDAELILNCGSGVLSVYVNRTVSDSTVNAGSGGFVPTFVIQIIKNGFGGNSSGLPLSEKAHRISDKAAVTEYINAYDKYSLPLVYLSGASEIDCDKLAAKLAGLASVLYDSESVMKEEYPEPIYVFFPHRHIPPVSFGAFPFHREIQHTVVDYLNSRSYEELETWNGIKSEMIKLSNADLLGRYKSAASDNDALTEMYGELEEKLREDSRLRDNLGYENNRLLAENARLLSELERTQGAGRPLVMRGAEEDFYPDEQLEIIVEILSEYLKKSVPEDTRRHDILASVIEANPAKGTPEQYRKLIKSALDGYKNFDAANIKKALKEAGIEIIEHTGHYKITLHGDHRYVCEAAATCSDHRGGLNLIAEINKKMF